MMSPAKARWLLLAWVLAGLPGQLPAATNLVRIGDFFFNPTNLIISVGDTVLWSNAVANPHDTTHAPAAGARLWESGLLSRPSTFTFTFDQTGFYPYVCDFHRFTNPEQTGTVSVVSANLPPSVAIGNPLNGARFQAPATIPLSAAASDSDGTVTNVQFFRGATLVGSDAVAPFSVSANNVPAGVHQLTARATDDRGRTATSAVVSVVVSGTHNVNAVGFSFSPSSLTVTVGDMVRFNNLLSHTVTGNTPAEPFCGGGLPGSICTVTFQNAGTFGYFCVPHVDFGMAGNVTVNALPSLPPGVGITFPVDGATLAAPAQFEIQANAIDLGGSVASVQFFANGSLLGADSSAPFSLAVSNLAAGQHVLTAAAADNTGLMSTSAPVTISVVTPVDVVLSSPQFLLSGFEFRYSANPGLRYIVEGSQAALSPAPFVPLNTNLANTNLVTFIDPSATNRPTRAYRVQRAP